MPDYTYTVDEIMAKVVMFTGDRVAAHALSGDGRDEADRDFKLNVFQDVMNRIFDSTNNVLRIG